MKPKKYNKWYQLVIWDEMRQTWSRMSYQEKIAIIESGADVPEDMRREVGR